MTLFSTSPWAKRRGGSRDSRRALAQPGSFARPSHSIKRGALSSQEPDERQGYLVHTAVRSAQRRGPIWISQTTDIFNAFDLIATRMDPPFPLRFVQVTTISHVSERIRKVDPVPMNPGVASVEIWAYVGGQKRLDRRYRDRKVWLPRNYFQIYHKTRNWEPDPRDRVAVGESARTPEIRVQRVRTSKEIPGVVRAPRRKIFAK